MNLRQKAKYYKKKYEELLNRPIKTVIKQNTRPVITLCSEHYIDYNKVCNVNETELLDDINKKLSRELSDKLIKYAHITVEDMRFRNAQRVSFIVNIVDMSDGGNG